MIPDGDIGADEHRSLLIEQLDALTVNAELDVELRAEADRLAGIARDLPRGIGRAGTVWIVWVVPAPPSPAFIEDEQEPGFYYASWQPSEEGEHDLYEDGPNFPSLPEALAWACCRSDDIVVAPAWDPGEYYRAGTGSLWLDMPPLTQPPGSSSGGSDHAG
jgi:hypothetical protein